MPSAPLDFLGMYSLYNLYVWTLAFVYAPLQSGGQDFFVDDSETTSGEDDGSSMFSSMMHMKDDSVDDMQL